jgi:hypothetical protein
MMSSKFRCLFLLRWESYACGGLLNLLIHLMLYLSSWHLRGRGCIESIRGSFWVFLAFYVFEIYLLVLFWFRAFLRSSLPFWLGLSLFVPFVDLVAFPSSIWPSWAFLDLWSSNCASWGLGLEIHTLCFLLSMDSSRGRLRNQVVSTLVWLWWVIDMPRFEFESQTFP